MSTSQRTAALLLILALALGPAGCSEVRLLYADGSGGTVSIPNNTDVWPTHYRSRALKLIEEQCPNGYQIVHEEKVVHPRKGMDSSKPYEYDYDGALEKVETTSSEYRIQYACRPAVREAFPSIHPPEGTGGPPPPPELPDRSADELPAPRPFK